MKLFHPLGFMLASPVETVQEALDRFSTEVAEKTKTPSAEARPDGPLIKEAQLEDKYDGVRPQIHCGSPDYPGRVALFSRSAEDMTAKFSGDCRGIRQGAGATGAGWRDSRLEAGPDQ